jgi:aryl-alcohol dehydrogenase-like predicted oxidoreductase
MPASLARRPTPMRQRGPTHAYAAEHGRRHDVRAPWRSGLLVSRVALGTMDFGYLLDESNSFAVMDAAVDAGINHFDTADVYGGPQTADMTKGYGVSEEVIGRWLQ